MLRGVSFTSKHAAYEYNKPDSVVLLIQHSNVTFSFVDVYKSGDGTDEESVLLSGSNSGIVVVSLYLGGQYSQD